MSAQPSLAAVQGAIDRLREELVARYGWTHLEVSAQLDAPAQQMALYGEVAVDRLVPRVVEAVQRVARGCVVDDREVRSMGGGAWHAVPGAARLLSEVPRWGVSPTAIELRASGGPVQCLGGAQGATVVRGCDGTVGWLDCPLGPMVDTPRLPTPHAEDPRALVTAVRPWLEAPYRLGGVTERGVDCSGLVQRLALDVLGVLLPRHSSDQLQVGPRRGMGSGVGDLSFVWSDREALCHVGIGTGRTVIHASLSRRRVVEDPVDGFVASAHRVMHVPFAELLAFGRRMAGQPSLTAAGFRLGRELGGSPL